MDNALGVTQPVVRCVHAFLASSSLLHPGDTLLVGVSGGADSVCLLHTLLQVAPLFDVRLRAAHLDHGLRGDEGEADASFVHDLCQRWRVPCTTGKSDITGLLRDHPDITSVEHAAREVRYGFFADVARQVGATAVAVGHTADDQVETVFLHVLRGSGTHGLGGMRPESAWKSRLSGKSLSVCRPLLEVRREDTRAYCRGNCVEFREDLTNFSSAFLRNRLRLDVMPTLREINPQVDRAILRLSKVAQQEDMFWQAKVDALWPRVAVAGETEVHLRRGELGQLSLSLQQRLIIAAISHIQGDATGIEFDHIAAALSLMTKGSGKRRMLPRGMEVLTTHADLIVRMARTNPRKALPAPVHLRVPGETVWGPWKITARVRQGAEQTEMDGRWTAILDFALIQDAITIRNRRDGDRFQPLGLKAPKKLQDCFVNAHIPREARGILPVLEVGGRIAWVAGLRIAEPFKVTKRTEKTIIVSCTPIDDSQIDLLQICDEPHYNTPGRASKRARGNLKDEK